LRSKSQVCFLTQRPARFEPTIATLAYSRQVTVTDSPPAGCAIVTVSDKVILA
jgi:hypothetical protein